MRTTLQRSVSHMLLSFLLLPVSALSQPMQWSHVDETSSAPIGPLLFHPSGVIFAGVAGGGGGMFASTDDGDSWHEHTIPSGPQVRALATTPVGTILWGTYGDPGGVAVYRSTDIGSTWNASSTGITGTRAMSLSVSPEGTILAGTLEQGMFRSTDDGVTWVATLGQQDWITAISFSPDSIAYACAYGGKQVYRSADDGVSWVQINTSYIDSSHSWPSDLLPLGNGVLYVSTYGEGIYKTTNDGASWTRLLNGEELQVSNNRMYTIVRDSMGVLYVGTDEAGAFMSTDDGASWTAINDGLLSNVVNSLVFDPQGYVYAGTETRLPDGGLFKSTFTALPMFRPVQDVVAFGDVLPGETADAYVSLVNTSLTDINVTGWTLSSADSTFTPDGSASVSVSGLDTLHVLVTFKPLATGQHADTLVIFCDAVNAPLRVALQGSGTVLPPDAPVLLAPTDNADSVLVPVVFRWHSATGAQTYTLDVATDQTFSTIVISRSSLLDTTVSIDALSNSTTYAWRIRAGNSIGETSSVESFMFRTVPAPPPPPVLISPVNDSTNVFQPFAVHWQLVDGASGYRVLVAEDSLLQNVVHDEQMAMTDSAAVWGLNANTRYYWTVLSGNAGGWGDTLEIRTLVTSLAAPVNANPTHGSRLSSSIVEISWEPVEGAIAYEVIVAGALGWPRVAWEQNITTTSLTVGPLFENIVYGWWVRAIGPFGPGPWNGHSADNQFLIPLKQTAPDAFSVRADWDVAPQIRAIGLFDSSLVFLANDSTFLFDGTSWTSYPPVYSGAPRRPVQYGNDLYTGMYEGASVWKFQYGSWTSAFSPPEQRAGMRSPMAVSQGYLWYGTHWNGKLYRWDGSSYTVFSTGSMEVCPVIEFDSTVYVFTNKTGEGKMFRYNSAAGTLDEVMVLSPYYHTLDAVVYNDKLYMSNYLSPHGVIEVYDGSTKSEVWDPGNNMWPMYYALSGDSLFVTVWNNNIGMSEIWLTTDGTTFTKLYTHPGTDNLDQIVFIQAYRGTVYFSTTRYTYRLNLELTPIERDGCLILTPNGGEVVHAGDSLEVKFIANYTGSYLVEWSQALYDPWIVFDTVDVIAGDTTSCWFAPTWPSDGWKVRASYAANLTLTDESDGAFAVAPPPPTLVSPLDNSINQPLSVRLEWGLVPSSTYVIEVALDSLFTHIVLRDSVVHGMTDSGHYFYTAYDLQRNTQYYWRVWSRMQQVESRSGPVRAFRTLGTVEVSASRIIFEDVAVGDSAIVTLAVRNESQSGSRLLQIGIAASSGRFLVLPVGEVDCSPGDSVMVEVMFRPVEYGDVRDTLIVTSLSDVVRVPIEGQSTNPGLSVVQPYVIFDQVRGGDSVSGPFRLTGASANPFFLDTIRTTTPVFEVTFMSAPLVRGDTIDVYVLFRPDGYGIFTDTLIGVLGEYEGPIGLAFGRSPWPFLAVEPQSVQFAATAVGSMDTIDLVLRDTTVNIAHVDSITFSHSVFSATYMPPAGDADSSLCRIVFSPVAAETYADTMYIWADVEQGYVAVLVSGSGIGVSSVSLEDLPIPNEFVVAQNYPNPFNPSTTIRYGVPEESMVRATVVDMAGRQIAVLSDGVRISGWYEHIWNASVASGVYFLRVESTPVSKPLDRNVRTIKMLLLR